MDEKQEKLYPEMIAVTILSWIEQRLSMFRVRMRKRHETFLTRKPTQNDVKIQCLIIQLHASIQFIQTILVLGLLLKLGFYIKLTN